MEEFKSQRIKQVVKDLLKKRQLTYQDVASQLECSVPTVKRILGPEELSLNRLLQLCEVLNVNLSDLERLSEEGQKEQTRFSEAQELFLAKNRPFFAYLLKIHSGRSPKQIAEVHGLNQRSTDKYLIGLERQGLIRVTGRQRVKPVFKELPSLGSGLLARNYFESFIRMGADFFIGLIKEALATSHLPESERVKSRFSINSFKISKKYFQKWTEEQEKSRQALRKMGEFEEKTKDPEELMTAVVLDAHSLLDSKHPSLKLIDETPGEIPNL